MSNDKILILGGNGYIGKYLQKSLIKNNIEKCDFLCPSSKELNISDYEAMCSYFKKHSIKQVIHLAARLDIDF